MTDAAPLVRALVEPASVLALDARGWTDLLAGARAEQLIGSLAHRCAGLDLPPAVMRILDDARASATEQRRIALWEAEMARRALAPIGCPVVLLKGAAFAAAGLAAGQGRMIGDLDLLVPRDRLDAVEQALLAYGWEWVKPDPYDDAYYRRWMHELPPLIHRERDRMIDVHHTILPLTARPTPDAGALINAAVTLNGALAVLSREDMVVHAAAHLFADGDLAGGLRNLWDIDRLLREFGEADPAFAASLIARARLHELEAPVLRSMRLAHLLFETPVPAALRQRRAGDLAFRRRLLARDGWGRETSPATRLAFYIRGHALRMPPGLLARHLWIKWRRDAGAGSPPPAAG